jgi:hypothetical protein
MAQYRTIMVEYDTIDLYYRYFTSITERITLNRTNPGRAEGT